MYLGTALDTVTGSVIPQPGPVVSYSASPMLPPAVLWGAIVLASLYVLRKG
jgi:hypothetical protein